MTMVGGLKALRSVSALAAEWDVDVLFFHLDLREGRERIPPALPALARSIDGIVAYQAWASESAFRRFQSLFPARFPIVNASRVYPGFPGTPADSYGGMRQVMAHLLDDHGYRRIGFIPGPKGNWAVDERLRAYRESLAERGIGVDERLVAPYVGWAGAAEGVHALMDERGLKPKTDVEALIGANDTLAIGAIVALRERGYRVPFDIAVAGYDDDVRASFSTPPLTTARYNMGLHAFENLLAMLEGTRVPERALTPAELVVRRSCGCQYEAVTQAVADQASGGDEPGGLEEFLRSGRQRVVAEMAAAVRAGSAREETVAGWMGELFDALARNSAAAAKESGTDFLSALEVQLDSAEASGIEPASWQRPLSILGHGLFPRLKGEGRERAEHAWQRARALVNEISLRERASIEYNANSRVQALRSVEMDILSTHSVADLTGKLSKSLPGLGIPGCSLALYGAGGETRLAMCYGGNPGTAPAIGAPIPADRFLPQASLPDGQACLVVEPLAFQDRELGFIAFRLGPAEGAMYDSLRATVSSALEGALLLEEVKSHSARLDDIVGRTLATSEEMLKAIAGTANQAKLVSGTASASREISKAGQNSVSDTVEGMKKVQRDVGDIAKRIDALETRMRQIGEIISALEDIVAQSDILAINANIQAARAGNSGQGFAVVAREMRGLTDKERQATLNIGLILEDIRKAAEAAAAATREGSAGASRGMDLAGRAGQTISELAARIEEAAEVASQISTSTEQQARAMARLVEGVQAIKDASSRTSAGFKDAGI